MLQKLPPMSKIADMLSGPLNTPATSNEGRYETMIWRKYDAGLDVKGSAEAHDR